MAIYYVSSSYTGTTSNGGLTTPWKTLAQVATFANAGSLHAGDTVRFMRGDTFSGSVTIGSINGHNAVSGTNGNPITFESYGTGNKPIFLYAGSGATAEVRQLFTFQQIDYWVVRDFHFTDTNTANNHITAAWCGVPLYIGDYPSGLCNHWLVENVDIELCGMGIVIWGSNNTFTGCTMSNFKNLKSTSGGGGEDYGANPFTMSGSNNTITHCFVSDGWAESLDFGYNGGFCEMIAACSNNTIMFNTVVDTNGFSEFGIGGTSSDNLYAYNLLINNGAMFWVNSNTQVVNLQFYNNVVVENNNSRFAQGSTNAGAGVVSPEAISHLNVDTEMFGYSGSSQTGSPVFNLKNNIFNVSNPLKIARTNDTKTAHTYNLYKLSGGSALQSSLSTGEVNATVPIWTNTTDPNPLNWNFTLAGTSQALNAGTNASLTADFAGNAVSTPPDMGMLEKNVTAALVVTATVTQPLCSGGTGTVVVAATGGTASYTGTGTFTGVAVGSHTYTVTDANSLAGSVTINIVAPPAIQVTTGVTPIAISGGTASATVTAQGGVGTLIFSLNGAPYVLGNPTGSSFIETFTGLTAGSYTLVVKDANSCTSTSSFTVAAFSSTLNIKVTGIRRASCNGGTDGFITIIPQGGTAPYSTSISGGTFITGRNVFTGLSRGDYNITLKDSTGSTTSRTIHVGQNSQRHC